MHDCRAAGGRGTMYDRRAWALSKERARRSGGTYAAASPLAPKDARMILYLGLEITIVDVTNRTVRRIAKLDAF
jgi:hypothetical protein